MSRPDSTPVSGCRTPLTLQVRQQTEQSKQVEQMGSLT